MATFTIPIPDSPHPTFTTVLEGVSYDITLHWNSREEAWYISLARAGFTPLFRTKVVNGIDLLRKYRSYANCPKGMLFVNDLEKDWGRLTRDGFSSGRFALYYLDEADRLLVQQIRR